MPELPEVQTTVNGLSQTIVGLRIVDVWSDYNSPYYLGGETIKDPQYFKRFKKKIVGKKITSVERRAKNILIHLGKNETILIHMKMTGHLLYGKYDFLQGNSRKIAGIPTKSPWIPFSPPSLKDPFNRHIHFVVTFSNGRRLAMSDSRKFAKVTLLEHGGNGAHLLSDHLKDIGPEPLETHFTFEKFKERLALRPNGKIKQVLTDQEILAGVGNIYADESLWRAGIHPMEQVKNIPSVKMQALFNAVKQTLSKGIDFGGDSMSDYRNVHGERGTFQETHQAYQKSGEKCSKKGCGGTIRRMVIGSRSAHYCDRHQKLSGK